MRLDKKVREAIQEKMDESANMDQEYVIELVKTYAPEPDVQVLVEREYKKVANRLISSYKDEKGVRDVFVIRNDDNASEYIDITRSKEIDDLQKVMVRLQRNMEGNAKSLLKVRNRLTVVEKQRSLFDTKSHVQ